MASSEIIYSYLLLLLLKIMHDLEIKYVLYVQNFGHANGIRLFTTRGVDMVCR